METGGTPVLRMEAAGFVDFDAVAEGVVDEKAAPGDGAAGFGGDAGGLQLGAQGVDVCAFEAEMAIGIRAGAWFFDGNVNVEAADHPLARHAGQRGWALRLGRDQAAAGLIQIVHGSTGAADHLAAEIVLALAEKSGRR